ncbi:MAG: 50S ribosomal protein L9 [Chloroflexi bacterium]|nr:50S ribosomal protein L9 [Chloroflexota bacterium]
MEVVFLQDVVNQARAGEVKKVADGYARNYLIPKGLAESATPEILKRIRKITELGNETRDQETLTLQALADALKDISITVIGRVTPAGRYYGAISSTQIAAQLSAESGRDIERRLVETSDVIREPGEYDVIMRLSTDITASVHIVAEAEE